MAIRCGQTQGDARLPARISFGRTLSQLGFVALFALGSIALAQDKTPVDSAALLAKMQTDKRQLVEKNLNLSADEAKRFWPLYEKFQHELAVPQREYTRAVNDFVAADQKMSNANADRLAKQVLAASVNEAKLRQRQYGEAAKVLPATKAARYMQIENKLQSVQRFETAKAIPLTE